MKNKIPLPEMNSRKIKQKSISARMKSNIFASHFAKASLSLTIFLGVLSEAMNYQPGALPRDDSRSFFLSPGNPLIAHLCIRTQFKCHSDE